MHRLLSLALLFLSAPTLPAADSPAPLSALTYSGDQKILVTLDGEIRAAGKETTKLAALEKRLLAELAKRDATFAARQAIAQRLALVLAASTDTAQPNTYKALTAMLVDARDSDVARLALQPVPGATIDALFVTALPKSTDRARLGLIDSIAIRRIPTAVDALKPLVKNSDSATAHAAARALGEIGTTAALAALRSAPIDLTAAARLAAATRLPATEALAALRELRADSSAPEPVRHAAFRTSLDLDPATATTQIAEALAGSDWTIKQVALEAVATSRAPNLTATLSAKLPSFDAPTQAAVVTALSRSQERERVDTAVILKLTSAATDPAPRTAAITALGFLPGNRDIVAALAKIAASDSTGDAKLARQSLARLDGPDVSAAILSGAEKSDATLRTIYIEQLALRNQTEGIPLLLKTRSDPSAPVRLAALAALGEIAPISEQRALLDWTLAATDEAEQSRALRSLVNLALRDPAADTRGQFLFDALDKAQPDVALRLLPALNRIGGAKSAEAAARLATRDDPKLAEAAVTALTRWTDGTALASLATVAEKSPAQKHRDSARAGVLRHFERNRDPWTPATTEVVSRLLEATTDAVDRKKLVALLHRAQDDAALDLAKSLSSDADASLADAAKTAAEIVAANKLGKPKARASGSQNALNNLFDRKTSTRWNVPAEGEEWLELDFRATRPLHTITLDQTSRAAEFPERYEVHVTDDPKTPGPVVVSGKGQQTKTIITLPANTRGRYVIIKNVAERKDSQWSIVELYVD